MSEYEPNAIRFALTRDDSAVADGVLFEDGSSVLRWRGDSPSTAVYGSFQQVIDIHHVGDGTGLWWFDGVCFACGSQGDFWQWGQGNGGTCRKCGSQWEGAPSFRQEPSDAGKWVKVATLPARAPDADAPAKQETDDDSL